MIGRIVGLVAVVAVVAGLIWRLDTNGWGSLLWLVAAAATGIIRAPFEAETRQNTIDRQERTQTERPLLFLVMLGSSLIPLIHLLTGVFGFADYDGPGWLPLLGIPLLVPGLWLFRRSHTDLGRNWSVTTELREDHTLVTSGVYQRVRHPMYTSLFFVFAAFPFFVHNWIAGFAGLAAFAVMYVVRVPYEESMMTDRFGEAYAAYQQRTGRLWPRLR